MGWFGNAKDEEPKKVASRVYKFEDFIDGPAPELPEDASRLDKFEKEVVDLRNRVNALEYLKASVQCIEQDVDGWFRNHIAKLCDEAAKEFGKQVDAIVAQQPIQQVVEATFQRESKEFGRAIAAAVLKQLRR